ncbi:MAG: DUF899 domain-containing protein [Gammaproteobacteria bacterium]
MSMPDIVSREEWLQARLKHLEAEKAFDRQRDALSAARRDLPWVRVEEDYVFDSKSGPVKLADLFGDRSQLIIYHFMYHPSWEEGGCPACSLLGDHFDGIVKHLGQRDCSFAVVAKASVEQIEKYQQRLGWHFEWVSSGNNNFNRDYNVAFTAEEIQHGVRYNYRDGVKFPSEEGPGASVFTRNEAGEIFHSYSTYARGLDKLIGTYHFLDITPKGRDEDALPFSMAWVRRHDEYED